jgi:hypothetical protein
MSVNVEALAEALPDDTEWSEDELEALIARIAEVPEPSGAATNAARAMLVAAKLVVKGTRDGHDGYRYRKNPSPPKPLSFMEQQQAGIDRAVADERDKLRQINEAERNAEELLNGPARRAEDAQFRARAISLLVEFGLLPEDTPIPVVPQVGSRIDYHGPPQPGSFAYSNGGNRH